MSATTSTTTTTYRDHPIPTTTTTTSSSLSYTTGNANGGSGWDDSQSSSHLDHHDIHHMVVNTTDVVDVPLDTHNNSTSSFEEYASRHFADTVAAAATSAGTSSFPHVEEMKVSSYRSSSNKKKRHIVVLKKMIRTSFHGRNKFYTAICLLVLVVIILSISLSSNNNSSSSNSNSSSNTSTSSTTNNNNIQFNDRKSTKEEIFDFLISQNIYTNISYYINQVKTPQHRAVAWLAREDHANLPIPNIKTSNDIEIYTYLVRYIMAINYYAFDGPNQWMNKLGFLSKGNICTWQGQVFYGNDLIQGGIFCSTNNYTNTSSTVSNVLVPTEIRLGMNNAKGQIPSENGLLSTLTIFDIGNSIISGTIPTELCHMWNMETFDVSYNQMIGPIPPCFNAFTSLRWLYLNHNQFDNTIPKQLQSLTQLERLIIEHNNLSGNPISILNQMNNIQQIFIGHNQFTGTIDSTFVMKHRQLQILDISNNQFQLNHTTGFPHHLFSLKSINTLDLSDNPLKGFFPKVLLPKQDKVHKLQYFSIRNTQMTGTIPNINHQFVSLQNLDLSYNDFHGTIPIEIGNITTLELLYLSENPKLLMGTIPSFIEQLTQLQDLSMRHTNRNGPIPTYIGERLTNLTIFDVGLNNLTTIPNDFTQLSQLQYLLLNGNTHLSGRLGIITHKLQQLQLLLIDGTNVSHNIQCPPNTTIRGEIMKPSLSVYVECNDPQYPSCPCCICCDITAGTSCSLELLHDVDTSWEHTFNWSSKEQFKLDEHT